MKNFNQKLEKLLKKDARFVDQDGDLLKSEVIDKGWKVDSKLVELLLDDKEIKAKFFSEIKGHWIFNVTCFVEFVQDKNFLNDSYTKFKNKIGLTIDGKYLNQRGEVALAWPYKDCVLEGGMTDEESKRDEIFFNEILAQDEIDRLLDPKVLTNFKRYTQDGEQKEVQIKRDKNGHIKDNLIIKGNNLLALHCLKKQFAGKVKLIYIDPPYNTGNDGFKYNDRFNHSTWLTFMKNRLEVARDLLREDGVIFINIDDGESHYLKCLCDEIFRRENFVANIVWQKKYSPQNDAKWFSDNHDHILVFAKSKETWYPNLLDRTEEQNARYKNPDNDPRGIWKSSDLSVKTYSKDYDYTITTPNGRIVNPPKGRCWRTSKNNFEELLKDNRIWFGENQSNVPSIKRFLSEVKNGLVPKTIWFREEVGDNQESKKEFDNLGFNVQDFSTPKPERLLQRIIHLATKEDDIILDFFGGSGTTAAVAIKMKRQFITCEQMNYCNSITVPRLQKVIGKKEKEDNRLFEGINFDTGGVSKAVDWKGGGDFIYFELKSYNQEFIDRIQDAKDTKALEKIWQEMKEKSFLNWNVDFRNADLAFDEWKKLDFEKQQHALIQLLNKNQLYVNLSEIEDKDFKCSEEEKRLSEEFYNLSK